MRDERPEGMRADADDDGSMAADGAADADEPQMSPSYMLHVHVHVHAHDHDHDATRSLPPTRRAGERARQLPGTSRRLCLVRCLRGTPVSSELTA